MNLGERLTQSIDSYFGIKEAGSTIRRECMAGCITFIAMAYIIIVNPSILEDAGMPFGAAMAATILTAFFGTLVMGVYAKRPFGVAPYMGENAFIAYTVCGVLGYSWQTALGAIFLSGVLFTFLTVTKWRVVFTEAVSLSMKNAIAAGLGLFITFVGLIQSGIITTGTRGGPLMIGNLQDPALLVAVAGFLLIGVLMIRKVHGALLIGIMVTALLAFILGVAPPPEAIVSLPPSVAETFLQLDIVGVFTWGMFAVVLSVFTMDLLDTMGTLIGVSARAGFLDEDGNLPQAEKPFLADALATTVGALFGTTTTGAYVESVAGIEAGGRTGLVAVVVSLLFLSGLFFYPLFIAIPSQATGAAMVFIGLILMTSVGNIRFDDYTESVPAFIVITMMTFTYNIGVGLCAGFVVFPFFKVISGKHREVSPAGWVLCGLCLLFFIFYPY